MHSKDALEKENFIVLLPMKNLVISKDLKYRFKLGDVEFIDREYLLKNLKRYKINESYNDFIFRLKSYGKEFNDFKTFALVRSRYINEDKFRVYEKTREAVWILAASQVVFSKINSFTEFGYNYSEESRRVYTYCFSTESSFWNTPWKLTSSIKEFRIDKKWLSFTQNTFYKRIIKIVNKKDISKWERDLLNATIYLGKAVLARSIWEAYLNRYIVLDILLLNKGENGQEKNLIKRVDSLIGWIYEKKLTEKHIKRLYHLRNELFHKGTYTEITPVDVINLDTIVKNVLYNVVNLNRHFKSKDDVIIFSKKLEAYTILNKQPKRPKNLIFYGNFRYNQEDLNKIKLKYQYISF